MTIDFVYTVCIYSDFHLKNKESYFWICCHLSGRVDNTLATTSHYLTLPHTTSHYLTLPHITSHYLTLPDHIHHLSARQSVQLYRLSTLHSLEMENTQKYSKHFGRSPNFISRRRKNAEKRQLRTDIFYIGNVTQYEECHLTVVSSERA